MRATQPQRSAIRVAKIADRAEALVRGVWHRLVAALDEASSPHSVLPVVRRVLHGLSEALRHELIAAMRAEAAASRREAAAAITARLTPEQMRHALATRRRRRLHEERLHEEIVFDLSALLGVGVHSNADGDSDDTDTLARLLFPPPRAEQVDAIVYATGWVKRLAAATRLAEPERLAPIISAGMAAGKTRQQLVRDLLPIVDGVRSTARRIARTEGMRVAGAMQMATHESLGDLVVGYRINATLDSAVRPEHRERDGTIYWRHPKAGQLGFDRMPNPPQEADGSTAWNCRCWLEPILSEEEGAG